MGPMGGTTFMSSPGMGPGVFHFSSGGPGGGVFRFSTTSMGPGGGFQSFQTGGPRSAGVRRRPPFQREEEEQEPEAAPAWMKTLETISGSLGPLLPLVAVSLLGFGIVLFGAVLQFFLQRMMLLMPIMYLT